MIEFFKDFFTFLKTRKKFWMVPVFFLLFMMACLFIFAQTSALAPFIYTLF